MIRSTTRLEGQSSSSVLDSPFIYEQRWKTCTPTSLAALWSRMKGKKMFGKDSTMGQSVQGSLVKSIRVYDRQDDVTVVWCSPWDGGCSVKMPCAGYGGSLDGCSAVGDSEMMIATEIAHSWFRRASFSGNLICFGNSAALIRISTLRRRTTSAGLGAWRCSIARGVASCWRL